MMTTIERKTTADIDCAQPGIIVIAGEGSALRPVQHKVGVMDPPTPNDVLLTPDDDTIDVVAMARGMKSPRDLVVGSVTAFGPSKADQSAHIRKRARNNGPFSGYCRSPSASPSPQMRSRSLM